MENTAKWRVVVSIMGILVLLLPFGCTYNNEEEEEPKTTECTITTVSYLTDVKPILQASCYSCHSTSFRSGNVYLDTYEGASEEANDHLLPAITHEPGHTPMPLGGSKLPPCDIAKITKWINAGAPNN